MLTLVKAQRDPITSENIARYRPTDAVELRLVHQISRHDKELSRIESGPGELLHLRAIRQIERRLFALRSCCPNTEGPTPPVRYEKRPTAA